MKNKSLLIAAFLFISWASYGQFDKKLTFDVSVGYAQPSGDELRKDRVPHLYANFNEGYSFSAKAQYNLKPKFSFGLSGELTRFADWVDPRSGGLDNEGSFINTINIAPFARYKFLNGKFSPYVLTGFGVSVYNGERSSTGVLLEDFFLAPPEATFASIDEVQLREPARVVENNSATYFMAGFGVEYQLSQTLGIFGQATYNFINSAANEVLRQDIVYTSVKLGVNLNLAKSKTL